MMNNDKRQRIFVKPCLNIDVFDQDELAQFRRTALAHGMDPDNLYRGDLTD